MDAMERMLWFAGGVAVGFMAGSRAGRPAYDAMATGAHRMWTSKVVQDALETAQTRASRLYDGRNKRLTESSDDMAAADESADVVVKA